MIGTSDVKTPDTHLGSQVALVAQPVAQAESEKSGQETGRDVRPQPRAGLSRESHALRLGARLKVDRPGVRAHRCRGRSDPIPINEDLGSWRRRRYQDPPGLLLNMVAQPCKAMQMTAIVMVLMMVPSEVGGGLPSPVALRPSTLASTPTCNAAQPPNPMTTWVDIRGPHSTPQSRLTRPSTSIRARNSIPRQTRTSSPTPG